MVAFGRISWFYPPGGHWFCPIHSWTSILISFTSWCSNRAQLCSPPCAGAFHSVDQLDSPSLANISKQRGTFREPLFTIFIYIAAGSERSHLDKVPYIATADLFPRDCCEGCARVASEKMPLEACTPLCLLMGARIRRHATVVPKAITIGDPERA